VEGSPHGIRIYQYTRDEYEGVGPRRRRQAGLWNGPDLTAPYPVLGAAARIGPGGPQGDLKASAGVWEGRSDEFGESRAQHVSGLTIDLNSPGSSQRSHVTLTMPTRGPEQATIEAETITCIENMNESKAVGVKSRARASGSGTDSARWTAYADDRLLD